MGVCLLLWGLGLPQSISASSIKPAAETFPFTPIPDPMFHPDTLVGDTLVWDSLVRISGWQRFQHKVDRMTQTRL